MSKEIMNKSEEAVELLENHVAGLKAALRSISSGNHDYWTNVRIAVNALAAAEQDEHAACRLVEDSLAVEQGNEK